MDFKFQKTVLLLCSSLNRVLAQDSTKRQKTFEFKGGVDKKHKLDVCG